MLGVKTACWRQVMPPSVDPRTTRPLVLGGFPITSHTFCVGHDSPSRDDTRVGSFDRVQCAPPSVERMTEGESPRPAKKVGPIPMQVVADVQLR